MSNEKIADGINTALHEINKQFIKWGKGELTVDMFSLYISGFTGGLTCHAEGEEPVISYEDESKIQDIVATLSFARSIGVGKADGEYHQEVEIS